MENPPQSMGFKFQTYTYIFSIEFEFWNNINNDLFFLVIV